MKTKALALVLAICMVLALLPATATAAMPTQSGWEIYQGAKVTLSPTLKPAQFEPMVACDGYDLQVYSTEGGIVLYEVVEDAGHDFVLYTEPEEGYYLEGFYVEYSESAYREPSVKYSGLGTYECHMPDSDLKITAIFTELSGPDRDIDLHIIGDENGGKAELSITKGKTNQTIFVYVEPARYHYYAQCYGIYGKNKMEAWEGGGSVAEPKIVELVVPDRDMDVYVQFLRYGPYPLEVTPFNAGGTISVPVEKAYYGEIVPITIIPDPGMKVHYIDIRGIGKDTASISYAGNNIWNLTMGNEKIWIYVSFAENINPITVNAGPGGTAVTNVTQAKVGDIVTLTCTPDEGYRLEKITGVEDLTDNGDGTYTFTMPGKAVTIDVTFKYLYNPVAVTVETGIGGTASVDVTEAKLGDTVTLTCAPEEGYRVARITGVKDLTDNGDGTYAFTMPDEAVAISVLFLRENNPFLDVNETHFFYDPVLWAVEEGITSGMTPETFGPFSICNRAQVVTFLWRAAGSPEPSTTENPFTDVPAGSFYEKPVLWALENGITTGATATTFDPNGSCMRAHVVTFLWRAKGCPEPVTVENPFEDVTESDFYYKAVLWALENGVTTGADATHFNPFGLCQRAQVVTFLYRAKDIPMTYALDTQFDAEMGTVTLSHTKAQAGEVITATVVPAEGYVIESVTCLDGTGITQVSDTEFTFVMPEQDVVVQVTFAEIPVEPEPTDPTEPEVPTDPTDPTEPEVPTEPEEPVKTYELDLRDNGSGKVAYVDGKMTAAPGESIFFYALPNEGYYLDHVGIFNPDGAIDVSSIQIHEHGDGLYELIMIPHDLIMTCYFYPIG